MKTIGLLGGTGWESTVDYYKIINTEVVNRIGKDHSAKIILLSIDFIEISSRINKNDFEGLGKYISGVSKNIEAAGAECLVICANTLHMFAEQICDDISIPLIHIADATAAELKKNSIGKAALLGTRPTMEMPFYKNRLKEIHGIDVIVPEKADIDTTHEIITTELLHGNFRPESKKFLLGLMDKMVTNGVECVILGCTDFRLIISQDDTNIKLFETAEIHARAAVDFALS